MLREVMYIFDSHKERLYWLLPYYGDSTRFCIVDFLQNGIHRVGMCVMWLGNSFHQVAQSITPTPEAL